MKTFLKILSVSIVFLSTPIFSQDHLLSETDTTFNPSHLNSFSGMMGFNSSLTKSADLSNFAFSYGRKMNDYWLDTNLLVTTGLFHKFSSNNPTATGATDDDLAEQENSLTTFGVGIGRETRYAQSLLPFNDIYELMAANLTYNSYKEDFSGKSFTGPGLLAKFAVYKRFGDYFSAGAHLNYNLAVVKRAEELEGETNSQKSLTLGFLTLGFNLTLYL